jgi:hypothetical protein
VAGAALGARHDCFRVASAAFSAAKDRVAGAALGARHVFSCGQRNIFSSQGSFCVAGAALEARYDQKVARGCSATCSRNVLRAFKEIRNITFSVFHLSWLYLLIYQHLLIMPPFALGISNSSTLSTEKQL